MKGYVALNEDMIEMKLKSDLLIQSIMEDKAYEVKKKYSIPLKIFYTTDIGYIFFGALEDIYACFINEAQIYEVKAKEVSPFKVGYSSDRYQARKIMLLRKVPKEEIRQYFCDNQEKILEKDAINRATLASQGFCLEKLVHDEDPYVRANVALQGYSLDTLIHDEMEEVRAAVARQKYSLDTLINDKSPLVRIEVAKQGYGLDFLMYDEDFYVRKAVIE